MEHSPTSEANRFSSSQEIPRILWNPKVHSQQPAICPYPQPDPSSPHPFIPLLEDPCQHFSPIYASVFQVLSFPQVFSPKPC